MATGEAQYRRLDTIRRADALIELRRWPQALQELAPLLAGPDDGDALCRGAQALIGLHRNQEAAAIAGRAITAAPANEWAHRLRSRALLEESREADEPRRGELLGAALASAREAVRLRPRSAMSRRWLAQVLMAVGDYPHAAAATGEALNMDPNSADGWLLDGRLALAFGQNERAEQSARRAIEIEPNNSAAWNNLGVAIHRQGRSREAAAAYLQSARLDPLDAVARGNISLAGMTVLRTLGLLALLPLLLVPWGPAIFVAAYAAGIFLCRPKGLLRARTERAAIRVTMRLERLPWRQRVSQSTELRTIYLFGVAIVMVAFFVIAPDTPAGVTFLALVAFVVLQALRAPRTKRRRRAGPGTGGADWSARGYGRGGSGPSGLAPDHYRPRTGR